MRLFISTLLVLAWMLTAGADISLPGIFTDGMVLQQGMPVPIWGTAANDESVTVTFAGQTVTTKATAGTWRVALKPLKPGGPWPMTIDGHNHIALPAVYVGEVWVCSGQSNMEFGIKTTISAKDVEQDRLPLLHLYRNQGPWTPAGGAATQEFSAVAYFFGKALAEARNVPIGLIQEAVGGSMAEEWTPGEAMTSLGYQPNGRSYYQKIRPLQPYAIKGVIWYQGESNTNSFEQVARYPALMTAMIAGWRKDWGQGNFPFLYIQLPRIDGPPEPPSPLFDRPWPDMRDAQTRVLAMSPNTGMAIYSDQSDGNLHAQDKRAAGARLALLARGMAYGEKILCRSPLFKCATRKGNTLTLTFTDAKGGLVGTPADDLFLVYPDGKFKAAKAQVAGETIKIDLTGESALPEICYGWSTYPLSKLFNKAGLPVGPFRLVPMVLRATACHGNTITITANVPLDPAVTTKTKSYRIAGCRIRHASLSNDRLVLTLTLDTAMQLGQTLTVRMPGLTQWDGTTRLPDLAVTAE